MEQYSIDGQGRGGIYIVLAIVSVALAYLAHQGEHLLPFEMPWWLAVPSFAVWFGLVNVAYDRWLWRVSIAGFRFSPVPDFSGSWRGKILAVSASQEQREIAVEVRIRQTWSSIEVRGKTSHGITRSKLAGVRTEDSELRYEYETQPEILDPTAKHHLGFCVLELREPDLLEGYYYTLDGTSAKGGMRLERVVPVRQERTETRVHAAGL